MAKVNDNALVESKSMRDSYIDRTDVLDKVKKLSLLPNNTNVSVEMAANYYEVSNKAIESLIYDNRDELESDGLKVLRGSELSSLKKEAFIGKFVSQFTIIPRRALLRIGMLLRDSAVAQMVRTYLLDTEHKSLPAPSYMIEDPIKRAQQWIEEQREKQALETKTLMLEQRVAEYEPQISYLDTILRSKGTITITQIAKDYGMSGQALNQILHEEKVQYKQNDQWLLYRKYHDKGYTKSETLELKHKNGDPYVKLCTRWTQKGRLFIHEILKQRGIIPVMDRVKVAN